MPNIKEFLKKSKPDLAESSINSYSNCMVKLYESYINSSGDKSKFKFDKENPLNVDLKFLQNSKRVLTLISTEPITTQKGRLTCAVVFLKAINSKPELLKVYFDKMIEVAKEYQDWLKQQKKSDKQKENWMTQEELDNVINKLALDIKIYKDKEELTRTEYNRLQVYVLLRLLDKFSIRNEFGNIKVVKDTPKDTTLNYLVFSASRATEGINPKTPKIILNKFKTKKFLGTREYEIPVELKAILKILFKFNKSNYLLTKHDRKTELGSNGVSKLLSAFFKKTTGKSISTSMLRHISATKDQQGKPSILQEEAESEKIKQKYLHNEAMHKLYAKKD